MKNDLAVVERLKGFCLMNRELRNGVVDLRSARAMVQLARQSSSLCTRMLATDRRALPAGVDHDLATAGQAFAEVAWRIDEFEFLVDRAEKMIRQPKPDFGSLLSESQVESEFQRHIHSFDLEALAQALEPAAAALERAARAAGPYLKPLEQPPAAAPTKFATVAQIDAHFVAMGSGLRSFALKYKSQSQWIAYLREQGIHTSKHGKTVGRTRSWKATRPKKQQQSSQDPNDSQEDIDDRIDREVAETSARSSANKIN